MQQKSQISRQFQSFQRWLHLAAQSFLGVLIVEEEVTTHRLMRSDDPPLDLRTGAVFPRGVLFIES